MGRGARFGSLQPDMSRATTPESDRGALLSRLEIDITRRLDGILHGDYRGLVPGHGAEQGEARVYQPGDDIRRIDWNITAKTTVPHVRDTVADRELECWIVADLSPSVAFGTDESEKRDVSLSAATGVGLLTNRGGNRVGAIIGDATGITTIPPRSGRKHLMALLRQIAEATSDDESVTPDLAQLIQQAGRVARRRGLVVVISDFLDDLGGWSEALGVLGVRHEVLCIEVVDRAELELPNVGILTVVDVETGRSREVDTRRRATRQAYEAAARQQRLDIEAAVRAAGADHLRLDTSGTWLDDLVRHVDRRRRLSPARRST